MPNQLESHYTPKIHVRERPLHWCIILVSLLFIFLLVIESVAFIVLGAWHLTTRHLQTILSFSAEVHQRELSFGILLVAVGSSGVLMSILGLVAFFTLRLLLLRLFSICLWCVMIVGIVVGIIGILFASQVGGFMRQITGTNASDGPYAEEKFMLGMNGGLALFMSLTKIVGIIIVRCLSNDVSSYPSGNSYLWDQ